MTARNEQNTTAGKMDPPKAAFCVVPWKERVRSWQNGTRSGTALIICQATLYLVAIEHHFYLFDVDTNSEKLSRCVRSTVMAQSTLASAMN